MNTERRAPCTAAVLVAAGLLACIVGSTTVLAQDEGLQSKINSAVKRGREHLITQLPGLTNSPPGDYPMGRLALPLAACLKAGCDSQDPRIQAALRKLEGLPLKKVYCVSCYLFALDALAQREFKEGVEDRRQGKTVVRRPNGHRADGKVRRKMQECIDWLVGARARGMGYWDYGYLDKTGAHRHDFSNSQFAILGLQIGLEHRIPMPRQVFEEIAQIFIKSQSFDGNPQEVRVTYAADLRDLLKRKTTTGGSKTRVAGTTYKVQQGGWQYTANQKGAKASMTAAGASSLLIVRNALGRNSGAARALEKAIGSSFAWITNHFDQFLGVGGGHHGLYTMYSLEKVGDLGSIETFGGRNWYIEGAKRLTAAQKGNGSWGSYVDTAFALMFLTRATRLKPFAAPKITTQSQGAGGQGANPDLVYIARLEGFVSARDIFRLLEESRDSSLVSVGREVVDNYKASERERMVPDLVRLWTKPADRISRFAQEAIEEITGLRVRDPAEIQTWIKDLAAIEQIEKKSSISAEEIATLLDRITSPALKGRLVDLANRRRLYGIADRLVDELSTKNYGYRIKVNGVLALWSGRTVPSPEERDQKAWETVSENWRRWADREADGLVTKSRVAGLVAKLDTASIAEARKIVASLVALGPSAIGELESATRQEDYSFFIIEALEQLRGERIGLR